MNDSCGSRQDTSSAGSSEAASSEFDFDKNHPSSDEFEDDVEDEEGDSERSSDEGKAIYFFVCKALFKYPKSVQIIEMLSAPPMSQIY